MSDYLTQQDVRDYGNELLDVSQRAALHAISPHLMNLEAQNADLQRRLARESRHRLDQQVEAAIPNYREIDRNPNWHRWLLGYDVLSGEVRQRLLNAAIQRGDASSVIAFFRSYQRESGGTHTASPASGGRGRSSGGQPVFTRAQVKELYARHHRGEFAGKEAEWAQIEHSIIRAGAEGRILNGTDWHGK
jgi:hypothetical protein